MTTAVAQSKAPRQNRRMIPRSPVLDVELVTLSPLPMKQFCLRELRDKLIDECTDPSLNYVLCCSFLAGMRKKEIVESKANWCRSRIQPHSPAKTRWDWVQNCQAIPLCRRFAAFLKTDHAFRDPYMLAPESTQGRSRYRYDFRRPFVEYLALHDKSWIWPHAMRHIFSSLHA